MTAAAPQAFFLPAEPGQRYCLYHAASGAPRGMVVHVHPFAEELNKTRRMAALQARVLAEAGYAVLQIDQLGCGDSSGDFADARWPAWIDDVHRAQRWLAQTLAAAADVPLWLWGVRGGCLLAADAARTLERPCHLLFWQASFADGAMQLQQFLRLRLAADMLTAAEAAAPAKVKMEALLRQLDEEQTLEVAGYALHGALAAGLKASRLTPPATAADAPRRLVWLETSTATPPGASPLARRLTPQWEQAGWQVHAQAVAGPAFWQSAEIELAPELLEATVSAMAVTQPV